VLSPTILIPAIINGLLIGAIYALVALGLTLIYGVLHIINFAHGALLSAALFAAFFAFRLLGLDPYVAVVLLAPLFFALGYGLQRFIIGPASHVAGDPWHRRDHRKYTALRVPRRHADHRRALCVPDD
jgi:branched-chain amino acid transport system permease protein